MPGVEDKSKITLKRVRKRVPRHYVQVTANRPVLGARVGDDCQVGNDSETSSTFISFFDPNGDTFSMERPTEEIMALATLEAGIFTFRLDTERDDEN